MINEYLNTLVIQVGEKILCVGYSENFSHTE